MSDDDVPTNEFERVRRAKCLSIAAGDPIVQAASLRLAAKLLVFDTAASMTAKSTNQKYQYLKNLAKRSLQEAIELELLAMRTQSNKQSALSEQPDVPLKLRAN